MKRTDLAKNAGLKIQGKINQAGSPGRFGNAAGALPDRREQRKLDQALGLVPFAVKLNGELIKQVQEMVQSRQMGVNEVVADLLKKGLAAA
mgnify:CR=1 FL=1